MLLAEEKQIVIFWNFDFNDFLWFGPKWLLHEPGKPFRHEFISSHKKNTKEIQNEMIIHYFQHH